MNNQLVQIKQLLVSTSKEQRQELFRELRKEFPIHAIEQKLNAEAEIILEAISRAGDLKAGKTLLQRGTTPMILS